MDGVDDGQYCSAAAQRPPRTLHRQRACTQARLLAAQAAGLAPFPTVAGGRTDGTIDPMAHAV